MAQNKKQDDNLLREIFGTHEFLINLSYLSDSTTTIFIKPLT